MDESVVRVEVEEKHRYVFLSIFKEGRGSRCELTWVEFEKAMASLGFGISAGGGSAYKFTPTRVDWSEPVTMHRPHDGMLSKSWQDNFACRLKKAYGWDGKAFAG